MFPQILFFLFLGLFTGFITGLIPGLHPNTVFILSLSLPFLLPENQIIYSLVFIVSLSISNTFTDFIPTIIFGAPEPDSCLSVLPSHKLLLQGKGYEALFLTTLGGFGVTILTILTLPLLIFSLPHLYTLLSPVLHFILVFIAIWMIVSEKNKMMAFLSFFLSGLFGLISLHSLPSQTSVFPALTGLFGASALLITLKTKPFIPEQKTETAKENHTKGILTGWLAGFFAGLFPGIGSAQSGIIASQILKARRKDFITAIGGINTANIFFTFVVFYTLNKTRSGAAWIISQITTLVSPADLLLITLTAAITCFLSVILTLKTGKYIVKKAYTINYTKLNTLTLLLISLLVFLFTGFIGLFIMLIGTLLGIFTILSGIKRTHLMGFLLVPTILYFSGLNPVFFSFSGI